MIHRHNVALYNFQIGSTNKLEWEEQDRCQLYFGQKPEAYVEHIIINNFGSKYCKALK